MRACHHHLLALHGLLLTGDGLLGRMGLSLHILLAMLHHHLLAHGSLLRHLRLSLGRPLRHELLALRSLG